MCNVRRLCVRYHSFIYILNVHSGLNPLQYLSTAARTNAEILVLSLHRTHISITNFSLFHRLLAHSHTVYRAVQSLKNHNTRKNVTAKVRPITIIAHKTPKYG